MSIPSSYFHCTMPIVIPAGVSVGSPSLAGGSLQGLRFAGGDSLGMKIAGGDQLGRRIDRANGSMLGMILGGGSLLDISLTGGNPLYINLVSGLNCRSLPRGTGKPFLGFASDSESGARVLTTQENNTLFQNNSLTNIL